VVNDQHCTPTYVPHVARALRFLIDIQASGLYHVTSAGQTTWYEFAREIFRQAGLDVSVEAIPSTQWPAPAPRPRYSVLDCSKYRALPGAPSLPRWNEALAEYLRGRCEWESDRELVSTV
jgi:dTDP-4-dehydrorhamnose reductase